MSEKENKVELAISESDDGSAVVNLPQDMILNDHDEAQGKQQVSHDDVSGESNDDIDHPDDNDELRSAKRNRRRAKKDLIRKTNQEKDVLLEQLKRENDDFKRRLSTVERSAKTDGIMRIDRGIEDAQTQLEYAKMKLAESVQNGDGQGAVDAQTLLQNANDEVRRLSNIRRQADQEMRQVPQSNNNEGTNPRVQRLAADWMGKNSWYNPDATDPDSRVAKKMDELLAAQGWEPTDPDYWDELTSRLQKELPHRYNSDQQGDDNRNTRRPRNNVASSGREASASYGGSNRSQFVLSPERVKAMKEAGAWENPERKAKMIKQFISYDKSNRS